MGLPTGESPFRNLKVLSLYEFDMAAASYVSVVLSAGLSKIVIENCTPDASRFIMGQLSYRSPNLREVDGDALPPEASSILLRFHTLEAFNCSDIMLTPPLLHHLAMLPKLDVVSASLSGTTSTIQLDPATSFRSLTCLNLFSVTDYSALKRLLVSLNVEELTAIDILMSFDPRPTDMEELLNLVSRFTKLTVLRLRSDEATPMPNVIHSIEPLHRLSELRWLELHGTRIGLTDADIPALGKAWPDIEYFALRPNAALHSSPPGLTLAALPLFATHVPSLYNLATGLDATAPWPPSRPDAPPARSLGPMALLLDASPVAEGTALDVAVYISNVYPRAQRLNMYLLEPPGEYADCWAEIMRMVPVISRARKEEWERAKLDSSRVPLICL